MAKIGHGYGSEWHLLRFLGRHRAHLNRLILQQVPGQRLDWLDFQFDPSPKSFTGDRETLGMEFLPLDHLARIGWRKVWPSSGNSQNWDAVARIDDRGWLLVEAKANLEEIGSTCGAKDPDSKTMIGKALAATQARLGCTPGIDWTTPYYQMANRLVVVDHLTQHGENVHLLLVYFCGDRGDARRTCPANEEGWRGVLEAQQKALGLEADHTLSARVHKLFVNVRGADEGAEAQASLDS